jgi:uncharacterized protein YecE (DUF72 family)
LNESYFRFLQNNGVGHVFLQGYYMPPVAGIYRKFKSFLNSPVVIRLHGPDRSDIEKKSGGYWDKILEPKDKELQDIAAIMRELLDRKLDVYVNMNNHYEGSAPLSIKRLQKFMDSVSD